MEVFHEIRLSLHSSPRQATQRRSTFHPRRRRNLPGLGIVLSASFSEPYRTPKSSRRQYSRRSQHRPSLAHNSQSHLFPELTVSLKVELLRSPSNCSAHRFAADLLPSGPSESIRLI